MKNKLLKRIRKRYKIGIVGDFGFMKYYAIPRSNNNIAYTYSMFYRDSFLNKIIGNSVLSHILIKNNKRKFISNKLYEIVKEDRASLKRRGI